MAEIPGQTVNIFPINLLHKAFHILEDKGHSAFRHYINRVGMPSEDIERVLSKHNYIYDEKFKNKVDLIKNKFYQKIKNSEFEIEEKPL